MPTRSPSPEDFDPSKPLPGVAEREMKDYVQLSRRRDPDIPWYTRPADPDNTGSHKERLLADPPGKKIKRTHKAFVYLVDVMRKASAIATKTVQAAVEDLEGLLRGTVRPAMPFFLLSGWFADDAVEARCPRCVQRRLPCICEAYVDNRGKPQLYDMYVRDRGASLTAVVLRVLWTADPAPVRSEPRAPSTPHPLFATGRRRSSRCASPLTMNRP